MRPFILTAAFPPARPPSDLHPTHGMMGCHPAIRHKTFISVRNGGLGESEIVLAPSRFLHRKLLYTNFGPITLLSDAMFKKP